MTTLLLLPVFTLIPFSDFPSHFITEDILLKHTTNLLWKHTHTHKIVHVHAYRINRQGVSERLCEALHQVDGALSLLPSEAAAYLEITASGCFSRISVAVYNIISVLIKGSRGDIKQLLLALNRV